jgi:hypothetical protein
MFDQFRQFDNGVRFVAPLVSAKPTVRGRADNSQRDAGEVNSYIVRHDYAPA